MTALWIVLSGAAVVVAGVLLLRLHAVLALTLAALLVAALTPRHAVLNYELGRISTPVRAAGEVADGTTRIDVSEKFGVSIDKRYVVLRRSADAPSWREIGRLDVLAIGAADESTRLRRVIGRFVPTGNAAAVLPGDRLAAPDGLAAADRAADRAIGERLARGFGDTCAQIGLLIAMAAIIGKCLLDSGAADRIVRSALDLFGRRGAPAAFLGSGFLLGIPVFFDTVFYLMIPLGKAMRVRTGGDYLLYVLTIVAGATMAHSLVPPTPGPLLVAEQLGVEVGVMMLGGLAVGAFTVVVGYVYARFANGRWDLPLRASAEFSVEEIERLAGRRAGELPPLWLSLVPIVLPVVLIAGNTVIDTASVDLSDTVRRAAETLGEKNVALSISAACALLMLAWYRRTSRRELASAVQSALASGGVIILITAAGGAFGAVIRQTDVATLVSDLPQMSSLGLLVVAFLVTAAVRTAQGSATVAMITAAGVLSGLASSGTLPFHPVYLALAIGCGSKPISWMNDSGFWVICRMSGMSDSEGLRYVTPMSALMGCAGLGAVLVGASIWPMAA